MIFYSKKKSNLKTSKSMRIFFFEMRSENESIVWSSNIYQRLINITNDIILWIDNKKIMIDHKLFGERLLIWIKNFEEFIILDFHDLGFIISPSDFE